MPIELSLPEPEPHHSGLGKHALEHWRRGDAEAAASLCDEGLRVDPDDELLLVVRAQIFARSERFAEALDCLARCRAVAPGSGAGYTNAGRMLVALGRSGEAVELLETCARNVPRSAEGHCLLAAALMHSSDGSPSHYRRSQEHARIASELSPDWASPHFVYGLACINSSRAQDAEAAFNRALALKPGLADAHYYLAYALLEQDRLDDALVPLRRAVELNPGHHGARDWISRLGYAQPKAERVPIARYPRKASEFADVRALIREYILTEFPSPEAFITPVSRVFTLGSCFAQNIARGLRALGVAAEHVDCAEEINSTFANRFFLEWVAGVAGAQTEPFGRFFGEDYRQRMLRMIGGADLVIVSLGVAPCFFDRQSGEFASTLGSHMHLSLRMKQFVLRTTSVSENLANLEAIIAILRRLNPGVRAVLTVSPVPLKATLERRSAIVADCVSKSTLRVTAHEFMQLHREKVHYWPSFEMVRWLGGHAAAVFGNDDGSPLHVSEELIGIIIECFVRTFGDAAINLRLDAATIVPAPAAA